MDDLLVINVPAASLVKVLTDLSLRREVTWMEQRSGFRTHLKWAKNVVEEGLYTGDSGPITKKGLTGKGHVLAVSDTGLDTDHSFFRDSSVAVPYNKLSSQHRKLVTYYAYADMTDDSQGHGTHVVRSQ
jgi:subtilisin family serine protease